MRKKLCSALLILTLLLPTFAISPSQWAMKEVAMAYGYFKDQNIAITNWQAPMKRAELASLLVAAYEVKTGMPIKVNQTKTFKDVLTHQEAIIKANQIGLMQGVSKDVFDPESPVSREQVATVFYRFNSLFTPSQVANKAIFKDVQDISAWAFDAVSSMQAMKVIQGDERGFFNPKANVTNEQALLMMTRLLVPSDLQTAYQKGLKEWLGKPLSEVEAQLKASKLPYTLASHYGSQTRASLTDLSLVYQNDQWQLVLVKEKVPSSDEVKVLQESLKRSGYYTQRDGGLGPKTLQSLNVFKTNHPWLHDDSSLDATTLMVLADTANRFTVSKPSDPLALVNKGVHLPSDFKPARVELARVKQKYGNTYVSATIHPDLINLFDAAKKAGYTLILSSGYRDYQFQEALFTAQVRAKGFEAANQLVALPGQSEHQLGLAVDITSQSVSMGLSTSFDQTKEFKWLSDNAHLYGFILRYPKGFETKTGYQYEPWHYRHVGSSTVATQIKENNWTLEMYIEALK